jgi:hypothetical protein
MTRNVDDEGEELKTGKWVGGRDEKMSSMAERPHARALCTGHWR